MQGYSNGELLLQSVMDDSESLWKPVYAGAVVVKQRMKRELALPGASLDQRSTWIRHLRRVIR